MLIINYYYIFHLVLLLFTFQSVPMSNLYKVWKVWSVSHARFGIRTLSTECDRNLHYSHVRWMKVKWKLHQWVNSLWQQLLWLSVSAWWSCGHKRTPNPHVAGARRHDACRNVNPGASPAAERKCVNDKSEARLPNATQRVAKNWFPFFRVSASRIALGGVDSRSADWELSQTCKKGISGRVNYTLSGQLYFNTNNSIYMPRNSLGLSSNQT